VVVPAEDARRAAAPGFGFGDTAFGFSSWWPPGGWRATASSPTTTRPRCTPQGPRLGGVL